MTTAGRSVLDRAGAVEYLARTGLIERATASAATLGGGVSNITIRVRDAHRDLVIKQSLPRLRVADDWRAPEGRVLTEADAMDIVGNLVPGRTPTVIHRDAENHLIVIEHAPPGWTDWKQRLLDGNADSAVAKTIGVALATWHEQTDGGAGITERISGAAEAFHALRIEPYYLTTARRAPQFADPVLEFSHAMAGRRRCLVHGDLSPKNVLVAAGPTAPGSGVWIIDFEVAHLGDPAFDLAFLLSHLVLKSIHRPADRAAYDACAKRFADEYRDRVSATLRPEWRYVLGHVGCLLLARVHGKSPVEYLDARGRDAAWRLGGRVLSERTADLAELVELRDEVLG